jgi:hypothetical protein
MICDYGCGQEANFKLKNGRLCCCKSHSSCPHIRNKLSLIQKVIQNRAEVKEKISGDRNCGKRVEVRKKRSIASKRSWSIPEIRERIKKGIKEAWSDQMVKNKHSQAERVSLNRPETKQKISEASKKYHGRIEVREKMKQKLLDGHAVYMNSFVKNPSKEQVRLFKICCDVFIYPILNYPVCIRKRKWYCLDIADPKLAIDIEYDETYWHKGREEFDKRRDEELKEEGWKILRYRDKVPTLEQVKEDVKNVVEKDDE